MAICWIPTCKLETLDGPNWTVQVVHSRFWIGACGVEEKSLMEVERLCFWMCLKTSNSKQLAMYILGVALRNLISPFAQFPSAGGLERQKQNTGVSPAYLKGAHHPATYLLELPPV